MRRKTRTGIVVLIVAVSSVGPTAAAANAPRPSVRTAAPASTETRPLDLNTASLQALEAEPAIGPEGARAIIAARPFATLADLDRVRGISTERLEQIRARVHVASSAGRPAETLEPTGRVPTPKVDLNTARAEALANVPGIDAELARRIVIARPFKAVDELSRVQGMSAERLEQIRAHVAVSPLKPVVLP